MKDGSRTLWRCDPRSHEEHVTFEQLTRLLQVKDLKHCLFLVNVFQNS